MRKPATSKAHFPPAVILGARENKEPCKARKARRSFRPNAGVSTSGLSVVRSSMCRCPGAAREPCSWGRASAVVCFGGCAFRCIVGGLVAADSSGGADEECVERCALVLAEAGEDLVLDRRERPLGVGERGAARV